MWTCSYCVWTRWATFQISCPSYFSLFLLPPLARDWYLERGIGPSMPTWGQPKCHSYSQWLWNCGEFLIIIRFVRYLPLLWNHVIVWNGLLYNFLLALYHGLWDKRKNSLKIYFSTKRINLTNHSNSVKMRSEPKQWIKKVLILVYFYKFFAVCVYIFKTTFRPLLF